MSDKPAPEETPAPNPPEPAPVAPVSPAPETAGTPPSSAPPQTPSTGSRPPIDYAMPTQKSFIPTPALIRNIGCLLKLIVGFTVLICLGYFALVALNPKARQWALQGSRPGPGGAPPSGKGPTPFKALNQVLAIPAQAMGKTDDVVKANNARVGQLDGVIAEEEGKTKGQGGSRTSRPVVDPFASPAAGTDKKKSGGAASEAPADGPQSVSGATILALAEKRGATLAPDAEAPEPKPQTPKPSLAPAAPDTPDEMKLAGEIVIRQASPDGAPRASAAFFYTIVKLSISGVTQGKPGRALINNRLAYEGDEINRPLGITFVELDAANKRLTFRDKTGAVVTRSY